MKNYYHKIIITKFLFKISMHFTIKYVHQNDYSRFL